MNYEGYIVINNSTGAVVGGYPRPGDAHHYTRLGDFTGLVDMSGYTVVRVEGEV